MKTKRFKTILELNLGTFGEKLTEALLLKSASLEGDAISVLLSIMLNPELEAKSTSE